MSDTPDADADADIRAARSTCIAPKTVVTRGKGIIEFFSSLGGERCGAPATYDSPTGPLCTSCAEREMQVTRDGKNMLAIIAEQKGIPIERLLARYVRRG